MAGWNDLRNIPPGACGPGRVKSLPRKRQGATLPDPAASGDSGRTPGVGRIGGSLIPHPTTDAPTKTRGLAPERRNDQSREANMGTRPRGLVKLRSFVGGCTRWGLLPPRLDGKVFGGRRGHRQRADLELGCQSATGGPGSQLPAEHWAYRPTQGGTSGVACKG